MRAIELSKQAEERLHEIIEFYIGDEYPERGIKVINSLHQAFQKIALRPFSNKRFVSTEFINLDIRIYSHFKVYHIYYVVSAETIRIAEIFHVHQNGNKLKLDFEEL